MRCLLAAAALYLGYGAVTASLARALARSAPARAYRLAPTDGLIAAAYSGQVLGPDARANDRRRATALARAALRRDPAAVAAVATLGLDAQIRGDTPAARRMFAYSQGLSRRDLRSQLWAIEDAVSRGDVAAALQHYDVALRTSSGGADLLYPVLGAAVAEPAVRRELVRVLATKPPWGNDFLTYAAAAPPAPRAMAQLLADLDQAHVAVPEAAEARVIDALLTTGDAAGAWRRYASLRRNVARNASRDPHFTLALAVPTRFDWTAIDSPGVSATIEPSARGGRFDFSLSAEADGPILRQAQLLPPGTYTIRGSAIVQQADAPRPYWLLACSDGRVLARVDLVANGGFGGTLRVPSGCDVQTLTLVARPLELGSNLDGQLTDILLRPSSATP